MTAPCLRVVPPAPKPARNRKPKPIPSGDALLALRGAMLSLDASNRRAQLCLSGSFTTPAAAEDLKRLLGEVERLAKTARRSL